MTEPRPDTPISVLRKIYGEHFAPEFQSEDTVSSLLKSTGTTSLAQYLEHSKRGRRIVGSSSDVMSTVASLGITVLGTALKNLADK
jgi:hypothetical protein